MGTVFRLLELRQVRARPGRAALAVGGIALGVALVLAMQLINRAAVTALRAAVEAAAGRAELEIVATSDAGIPEDVLADARAASGVTLAVPLVEGPALVADGSGESVTVFGIDLGDADAVRLAEGVGADAEQVIDDPLVFLAQPNSVVVTRPFAAARGLALEDRVRVVAATGPQTLVVRGLLEPRGAARVYGSSLFVMDVYAAQRLLGRGERFDRIDLVLADGDAEARAATLRRTLPPGLAVERPARRGEHVAAMLGAAQAMLTSMSCIALVVAVFIVYNSLATVVIERRAEIGVLRALGARRRQVLSLWLGQALWTGMLGSALGTGLGLGLAHLLVAGVSRSTSIALSLPPLEYRIAVSPAALVAATAAGLAASLLAALLPALSAARIAPMEAIRQSIPAVGRSWSARVLAAGLAFVAVAAICLARVGPGGVIAGSVANLSLGAAIAVLSVPATVLLGRGARPLAARFLGVWGRLAGEASLRMPVRTATTVAALTLGLSMSAAMAILARSFTDSVDDWVRGWARQDLYVRSAFKERGFIQAPLAETLARELLGVPGVERVERFRVIRQRYGDDTIIVAGTTTAGVGSRQVAVSDNFALRFDKRVGDRLVFDTPRGRRRFRIARLQRDYNSDHGSITLPLQTLRRLWGDRLLTDVGVVLAPGAVPSAVRAEVLRRFGAAEGIQVLDTRAVQAEIRSGVARAFSFTAGLEVVTLLVAFLGIFDTVVAGVLARRREIGVLRAIGFRRRDVGRMFALEGLLIGGLAALLGVAAGLAVAVVQLRILFPHAIGYLADLHTPAGRLAAVGVAATALAVVAAVWPARRAARLSVSEALAYE